MHYYPSGTEILLRGRRADVVQADATTPQLATRIALCLTILDEASDAELLALSEAKAGDALIKAYRKEHEQLVRNLAESAGSDAAYDRGQS